LKGKGKTWKEGEKERGEGGGGRKKGRFRGGESVSKKNIMVRRRRAKNWGGVWLIWRRAGTS